MISCSDFPLISTHFLLPEQSFGKYSLMRYKAEFTMLRKLFAGLFYLAATLLLITLLHSFWALPEDRLNQAILALPVILLFWINIRAARYLLATRPWRYILFIPLFLSLIITSIIIAHEVTVIYVDHQLSGRSYDDVYNKCHKVWAARGLVQEGPNITFNGTQNSIESVQLAFDQGARGSEIDVYFDTGQNQFIVSHDIPYNLKNGSILRLKSLFEATTSDRYYWLDFKKLRHLNPDQLKRSVSALETLASRGNLKELIYVEGEAPLSLAAFRDAGFHTIFDTHPISDSNPLTSVIINAYKMVYYFGDFSVMAMNYGTIKQPIYGPRTRRLLGDIPVFVYHVASDFDFLQELSSLSSVRAILVENHSHNRYKVNVCS